MNTPDVINCILKNEKIKAAQFANKIGAKATQIYDLQSGKTKKISPAMADKIMVAYPHYKRTWLLTGEGEMIRSDYKQDSIQQTILESNTTSEEQPSSDYEQSDKSSDLRLKIISAYEEMLKSKDAAFDRMQKELAKRNDEINKLKALIKDAGLNLPHGD